MVHSRTYIIISKISLRILFWLWHRLDTDTRMNSLVWIAVGSIVMIVMFVAFVISFYNFLIGPERKGPQQSTDPAAVQAQIISISEAPGLILAGMFFGMSKTEERAGGEW